MKDYRAGDGRNLGARIVALVVIALVVGGLLFMVVMGAGPLDDPEFDAPPPPEESGHRPAALPLVRLSAPVER